MGLSGTLLSFVFVLPFRPSEEKKKPVDDLVGFGETTNRTDDADDSEEFVDDSGVCDDDGSANDG